MPRKSGTGGAARPTGETAVRRYTAAEWAEHERRAQERLAEAFPDRAEVTLRLVLGPDGARTELLARMPLGDGGVGQSVTLDADDTVALVAAAERVLEAHRRRAEGAAMMAWAQHVAANALGEV